MSVHVTACMSLCVFRSVKHYFLLDQGDFVVQFMDMAEDEMKKSMEGKNRHCLLVLSTPAIQ